MVRAPGTVPTLPRSLAILREIALARGLEVEVVDRFSGYLLRLRAPGSNRCFYSGTGPLPAFSGNDMVLGAVCRDKAFCQQLLQADGIAVPEGGHFFVSADRRDCRPAGREQSDAERFASALSDNFARPVVVKPNSGARARNVHLARDLAGLRRRMHAIAAEDTACLIQAYVDAPEFRLFLVGGEVQFCYAKSRPATEGDGRASVAELVDRARAVQAVDEDHLAGVLAMRGWRLDSVPARGERLEIGFVANISAAGSFAGFVEAPGPVRDWCRRLHHTVPLEVMGIDVFSPSRLADAGDLVVTDVNGSPALATLHDLGHEDMVRGVWGAILERYFA